MKTTDNNWAARSNLRPLDSHAKSKLGEADRLTDSLLADVSLHANIAPLLSSRKRNANKKILFLTLQCICVNALYRFYEIGKDGGFFFSRDTSKKNPPARYYLDGIRPRLLRTVADVLVEARYLESAQLSKRQPIALRASTKLLSLADEAGFHLLTHFGRRPSELVALKRRKRNKKTKKTYNVLLDYVENEISEDSRQVISAWIQLLGQIGMSYSAERPVPPSAISNVHRLFRLRNRVKPFEGFGRIQGFWQHLKSNNRRKMLIGNESCCEIDIVGSTLQMAYCLATHGMCPMPDPYGIPLVLSKPALRAVVKAASVRVIGHKQGYRGVMKSLSKFLSDKRPDCRAEMESNGISIKEILDEFLEIHDPWIGDFLLNQQDLVLMFWESQVALDVIRNLTSNGTPVLTTHDSYLCRMRDEEIVKRAIVEAFLNVFGVEIQDSAKLLKITYSHSEPVRRETWKTAA